MVAGTKFALDQIAHSTPLYNLCFDLCEALPSVAPYVGK